MNLLFISIILFLINTNCSKTNPKSSIKNPDITFDYNIPFSPQSFDPLLQRGIQSRYLLNHLHQTLYKWDKNDNLIPSGIESCTWLKSDFICKLKKGIYFQNKKNSELIATNTDNARNKKNKLEINAIHYIYSLELLKENKRTDIIDFNNVSFYALDKYTLAFKLKHKSESFIYKLSQIELSPRPEKKIYSNTSDFYYSSGLYTIINLKKNQNILLKKINDDIFVKIHFIEDQATALRIYERNDLDLLTLIPVREFNKYKNSNEIFHVPMSRMDGIFFNSKMDLNFKKALFHSLDFKKLKNLYHSIGIPGCPSLPQKLYIGTYCYDFDLKKAKQHLKKSSYKKTKLILSFSALGGDDIQRGMEWMAYEWNKNLNLNISIEPLETGVFLNKIKTKKFDIIRKGLPLDSPKCLDGLTQFQSQNINNINNFKNKIFDSVLTQLEIEPESKILCDQGLKILQDQYVYLPLGNMYFSFLQNHKFTGWHINSLNIVDLENLRRNPK